MPTIFPCLLPNDALLMRYAYDGSYTDCFCMDVPHTISLAEYAAAFYTTPLFKVERVILALVVRAPSTDEGARELAFGQSSRFAIWRVEGRTENQLMLCDVFGRTRSWLMVFPGAGGPGTTRLFFGSAVRPKSRPLNGKARFGFAFHALHGFHQLYSRALLRAARSRLASLAACS
ncbi:hypothetical protein [Noviherbaspirillum sp. ST9]|uniref:hypothetical protein n=1 Tax=Noviherbaspirillum sp. ST9 TaxID=3401606 RepID=UPI003B58A3D7